MSGVQTQLDALTSVLPVLLPKGSLLHHIHVRLRQRPGMWQMETAKIRRLSFFFCLVSPWVSILLVFPELQTESECWALMCLDKAFPIHVLSLTGRNTLLGWLLSYLFREVNSGKWVFITSQLIFSVSQSCCAVQKIITCFTCNDASECWLVSVLGFSRAKECWMALVLRSSVKQLSDNAALRTYKAKAEMLTRTGLMQRLVSGLLIQT